MTAFYLLSFFAICSALFIFPFLSTWREWRRPTDCDPLPISQFYTSETNHFADCFRKDVQSADTRDRASVSGVYERLDAINYQDSHLDSRHIVTNNLARFEAGTNCSRWVYGHADIISEANCSFTVLYTERSLIIGKNSVIQKWAHADCLLQLKEGSIGGRRLSSSAEIILGSECYFERISAPVIRFERPSNSHVERPCEKNNKKMETIPKVTKQSEGTFLVDGDCVLPPRCRYIGSLIVTGNLTIGEGTVICGDIKARKTAVIKHSASITGSLISDDKIYMEENVTVGGPVVSQTTILTGSSCVIGSKEHPTTITAENILAGAGTVTFGTVWATKVGVVVPI